MQIRAFERYIPLIEFTLSQIFGHGPSSMYYGHHGCYKAVKVVSNILKKAHGRKFEKE